MVRSSEYKVVVDPSGGTRSITSVHNKVNYSVTEVSSGGVEIYQRSPGTQYEVVSSVSHYDDSVEVFVGRGDSDGLSISINSDSVEIQIVGEGRIVGVGGDSFESILDDLAHLIKSDEGLISD